MTTAISPSQLWKKRLGDWVLNPYIGCEHGCYHCYCPAMPGVKFANRGHTQREWGKYLFPKPGLVDSTGAIRDLSGVVPDIAGDALLPASIARLSAIDPASLPRVNGTPRIGPCVGRVGKFVCIGLRPWSR